MDRGESNPSPTSPQQRIGRRTVLAGGLSLIASADRLVAQGIKPVQASGGDGLHYASLMELAKRIRTRDLSPVEVTKAQLARIEAVDTKLYAYREVMSDSALAQARKAETEIQAERYLGPLHGVPIAVKDLFYTKGVATAGGCKVLARLCCIAKPTGGLYSPVSQIEFLVRCRIVNECG